MFLKPADIKDKNTGKTYRYYKLCESYRIGNKIRHRTVLFLGKIEELETNEERKLLADRIEQLIIGGQTLFSSNLPEHIEKIARHFYAQIKRKGLTSQPISQAETARVKEADKDYQEVDISSVKSEDVRDIGSEWLCRQAVDELEIEAFLKEQGWNDREVKTALLHIISRAVYPASEHKTAQWLNDNSSVAELFDMNPYSINRFHLYRASNMLNKEKEGLEQFLSVRTNELFDLDDKIILYDLTNTFFEGRKVGSKLCKFAKSKEKRNDAKLVVLALVVNVEGFVKYSKIYRGNMSDCKTLSEVVSQLSERTCSNSRKPIVVIDAGIATEDNLKMLKTQRYNYICVTRSKLKDYEMAGDKIIQLQDKRKQPIEIRWVVKSGEEDSFLYVRSQRKAIKEASMNDHFCQRYEEELDNIKNSIHKKGGTKKYEKVLERIGRIKERYPAANKHYKIDVKHKDGITVMLSWRRKPLNIKSREGVYFIRTNIRKTDEKMLWDIYNAIREIEATFRILKTDLSLRPIFHQKDEFTIAHLNLCILAYIVVNTIRYRLKNHGIHYDWQNIIRIMNTQKAGTIIFEKRDKKQINIRVCSIPSAGAQEIYSAMGYKPMPFYRKKFVFPKK
jgi:hypothetical protein